MSLTYILQSTHRSLPEDLGNYIFIFDALKCMADSVSWNPVGGLSFIPLKEHAKLENNTLWNLLDYQ